MNHTKLPHRARPAGRFPRTAGNAAAVGLEEISATEKMSPADKHVAVRLRRTALKAKRPERV
jgi:hypothetical protein